MVFQDAQSALNPVFTLGEQLREPLCLHQGLSKKEAGVQALALLRMVGISAPEKRIAQYPHELSGGMRQRVMIAIALACRPRLLIADEPTSALDVTVQSQIMELIVDLNKKLDMGVLLITHDLGVVAETCTRVIIMYLGQVVEEAPVLDLFDDPQHPYSFGLLKSLHHIEGDRRKRLYVIEGTVPAPDQIPPGCRFSTRCPLADDRCRKTMPELRDIGGRRKIRCLKAGEMHGAQ
jgi:oligopeptide/dipeptide ABC transporter ATP-binding protein